MFKIRLNAILFFVALISCSSPTIEKQKTLGGNDLDALHSLCLTKDGGFIVGGGSFSQKSGEKTNDNNGIIYSDFWIIKFNATKEIQWQKSIGGTNQDVLRCITTTDDGGYAIAGESSSDISGEKSENSRGGIDVWVVKLDSIGNVQWDRTIGGSGIDICFVIRQTADGGYMIGGSSNSKISSDKTESCRGDFDMWAIKLDRSGKIEWNKTLGGNEFEFCGGLELTNDGGVILCGNSASDRSGERSDNNRGVKADCWIVKLDAKGKFQWDKTFGGKDDEMFLVIRKTINDGYILTSLSKSDKSNEKSENCKGGWDYWVLKIDSTGNKIWDKTIGGKGDDLDPWGFQPTLDGGYIIGGRSNSDISGDKTDSCRGDFDYWIVKLDKAGKIEWDKTIGGSGPEELRGLEEIGKDHYIVAGFSKSGISGDKTEACRGKEDYWIVYLND